jgi:hypothetical protein
MANLGSVLQFLAKLIMLTSFFGWSHAFYSTNFHKSKPWILELTIQIVMGRYDLP